MVVPASPVPNKAAGILNNITEAIGSTPMVRISRYAALFHAECEILAKCEFLNPGGSMKDRVSKRMIEEKEQQGLVTPGKSHIIEPTSGNTGIGVAMTTAAKGYRCTIVMPEKMSKEKQATIQILGAECLRTPTRVAPDDPRSFISVAYRMMNEDPTGNSVVLDQYKNPANPDSHYYGTGDEIVSQCGGVLDYVFVGAGTGGTIAGIAKRVKELIPTCKVIGIDPEGSLLARDGGTTGPYEIEGIGHDWFPKVLDYTHIDAWERANDKEAFTEARRLIRTEGMLVGGSSGSVLVGMMKAIRRYNIGKGQRVVVVLPDGIRNYMTKFVDDEWMAARGFPLPSDSDVL